MSVKAPDFQLKIADTPEEVAAAQRLRYAVFVAEMGAAGDGVDHALALEADQYDPLADHLLLIDRKQSFNLGVIGTYRLLPGHRLGRTEPFYSAREFDLAPLLRSGRRLLELGRSCVLGDYRGGTAMFELWAGLARYVARHRIDVLFGVASFAGTDPDAVAPALSLLHHRHLAPPDLCVTPVGAAAQPMDLMPMEAVDRRVAMLSMPPLIKAYLRVGGAVGQGAWIDQAFNTLDVCMILDVAKMPEAQRALYQSAGAATEGL